jgi:glycosyltransferase involved in cell wall biosynthesis
MADFERYIDKHNITSLVAEAPDNNLAIVIVIPAFDEPRINDVIDSVLLCTPTMLCIEILVVFNSGEHTPDSIKETNRQGYELVTQRYKQCGTISVHAILIENVRKKHAGVGFARKTGMDQAVIRLNAVQCQRGLIVSLDADTLVADNYLQRLEAIMNDAKTDGGTLFFEHCLTDQSATITNGIALYELHLRYYHNMLCRIGFPHSFYTLGSAFFVRAETYVRQGGMNRKQGGEDFYFLHKVLPKCNYCEDIETTVYPSGRVSQRVPFGTGPKIIEYLGTGRINTYTYESFEPLRQFFMSIEKLFGAENHMANSFCKSMPLPLNQFLETIDFTGAMAEINANASSVKTFRKRFFDYFDAFFIVKYLNFAHEQHFVRREVMDECKKLFVENQWEFDNDPEKTLTLLRQFDRERLYRG